MVSPVRSALRRQRRKRLRIALRTSGSDPAGAIIEPARLMPLILADHPQPALERCFGSADGMVIGYGPSSFRPPRWLRIPRR